MFEKIAGWFSPPQPNKVNFVGSNSCLYTLDHFWKTSNTFHIQDFCFFSNPSCWVFSFQVFEIVSNSSIIFITINCPKISKIDRNKIKKIFYNLKDGTFKSTSMKWVFPSFCLNPKWITTPNNIIEYKILRSTFIFIQNLFCSMTNKEQ